MPSRALIAVFGLLLLIFVATLFFREKPYEQKLAETYDFQCMACSHEWTAPVKEADAWYPGGMANDVKLVPCADCSKRKALLKRQCLWCKESYIPSAEALASQTGIGLFAPDAGAYRPAKERVPELCPHCGKDVLKWSPE